MRKINRTGIALSPKSARAMIEGASRTVPSMGGDEKGIAALRASYGGGAGPIGSVAPPVTLEGVAASAVGAAAGADVSVLLDKIGERLAFERTGTRLYEALISRFDPELGAAVGMTVAELERFRGDELEHFRMLQSSLVELGGDPTSLTPSADVAAVLSTGIPQVLLDARTTFAQCLDAMMLAELADHDGWEALIELARALGQEELEQRFVEAREDEDDHLVRVREWVRQSTLARAGRPGAREEATR